MSASRAMALVMILASPLRAQEWSHAGVNDRVAINLPVDVTLAGAGLLGFVVPELLKRKLAPSHCIWCDGPDNSGLPGDPGGGRGSLNGVDAFFHDALTGAVLDRKTADTTSSVFAFAIAPVFALGAAAIATGPHSTQGAGMRSAIIVLESSALSATAIQSIKFFIARKRPFDRYGHGTLDGTYDVNDPDSHVSFPSGHAAFATALGVSAAMTATLEESRAAPWLWAGAAVVSVTTASLRMIAEKHYFTDVASATAIGTGIGLLVPWLHRRGGLLSGSAATLSISTGTPTIILTGEL